MTNYFLKKLLSVITVITIIGCVFSLNINAQDFNNSKDLSNTTKSDIVLLSQSQYTESVTALPGEFLGPTIMNFSGNRLTISGNASVNSGSVSSVTIRLKKQVLGNLYSTVSSATLYPTGSGQNLFRDVVISPNANYKISYQVNGSADASANVFIAAISWTY